MLTHDYKVFYLFISFHFYFIMFLPDTQIFHTYTPGSKCETWKTQIALNDEKPGRGSHC